MNVRTALYTFDVIDSETFEKVGALRRKGIKAMFKDEWLILDHNDNEVGNIREDKNNNVNKGSTISIKCL